MATDPCLNGGCGEIALPVKLVVAPHCIPVGVTAGDGDGEGPVKADMFCSPPPEACCA